MKSKETINIKTNITFRSMVKEDWPEVAEIYRQGIATQMATFQQEVPTWEEWNKSHLQSCRIIATNTDTTIGWAALSPVSSRAVYAGVAEVSLYIAHQYRGLHIGQQLLHQLVTESERQGFWTLQASIFAENIASISSHTAVGFRVVGLRKKIAQLNGIWHDTVLMERRSDFL